MQLIKNATVVVCVGTESSHTAVQSQNSGSSRREFQIPLNIIIKIGDAIVGVRVVVVVGGDRSLTCDNTGNNIYSFLHDIEGLE